LEAGWVDGPPIPHKISPAGGNLPRLIYRSKSFLTTFPHGARKYGAKTSLLTKNIKFNPSKSQPKDITSADRRHFVVCQMAIYQICHLDLVQGSWHLLFHLLGN